MVRLKTSPTVLFLIEPTAVGLNYLSGQAEDGVTTTVSFPDLAPPAARVGPQVFKLQRRFYPWDLLFARLRLEPQLAIRQPAANNFQRIQANKQHGYVFGKLIIFHNYG